MTVTVNLPPETEARLQARAAAQGQEVSAYVQQLIENELQNALSLDEVLAPFRKQVEESGMTDEELEAFFEEVREEVWQEKQAQKGKSS